MWSNKIDIHTKLAIIYNRFNKLLNEAKVLETIVIKNILFNYNHKQAMQIDVNIFFYHNSIFKKIKEFAMHNKDENTISLENIFTLISFTTEEKLSLNIIIESKITGHLLPTLTRLTEISYVCFIYHYLCKLDNFVDNNYRVNKISIQTMITSMKEEFIERYKNIQIKKVYDNNNIEQYQNYILSSDEENIIPTGIEQLDEILNGGYHLNDLIIFAARPGVGKTMLCIDLFSKNISHLKAENKKCLYVSPDMNIRHLYQRVLQRIKLINKEEFISLDIKQKIQELKKIPLIVSESLIFEDILETIEYYKNLISILIIDYIQLIRFSSIEKSFNKNEVIERIIIKLKIICRKYNILLILVSQLNREAEKRKDGEFILSDLRDSGSLEQEADIVLFLKKKDRNELEIHIAKNRNGSTGIIEATIDYNNYLIK